MTPLGVATLLAVEVRRYLARRLTRVLIGVAVAATAVTAVIVFARAEQASDEEVAARKARREALVEQCVAGGVPGPERGGGVFLPPEARPPDEPQRREFCRHVYAPDTADRRLHLTDLWTEDGDAVWAVTSIFLGIGALIGAASMVGAEWKANTFTTLLTWEPRRVRVAVTKLAAAGLLAVVVAIALQLLLAGALLPTVLVRGTTEGADPEWARAAAGALARSGLLAGLAAVVGGSVAMIGRSTSAALGAAFAYLAVVEAILRAWKPMQARWLLGENATIFLTGRRLSGVPFDRPVHLAWITLGCYAAALVALATLTLRQRDVAA